jgi:hypothetical protein
MEGKSVSFETRMAVDYLRSKIETYKYRVTGKDKGLKRTDCINYRYQILTLLVAILIEKAVRNYQRIVVKGPPRGFEPRTTGCLRR